MHIVDLVLSTSLLVPSNGSPLWRSSSGVPARFSPVRFPLRDTGREEERDNGGMDGEMEGDVESGGGHRGTERRG